MQIINIGGMIIMTSHPNAENIISGRDAFINKYCQEKGWNKSDLSMQQIIEIRAQDGWKNPG